MRIYVIRALTHKCNFRGEDNHVEFRGPLSVFIDLDLKHRFTSVILFKAILSLLLMYRPGLLDADSWS